ncbi:MAG: tyrosine-type recombinase/integrase [Methanothrix sp.]|jgi:integrase/recombinase XerD|uniref:tyrosine-type recombinase/integrase n=1 Tax=Methanothrix sp. TaxID=90426 RepID=UPI0026010120|nr:tyrosine-type recombinase/integrase [Methanothrix sp.]MCK9406193.1 tyrosine-type recombinase/integrase [Methanothrix sp.]
MDMDRLIQDFVKDCQLRGMSPRSIPHYGYIPRVFKNYLEGQGVDFQTVDKDHLRGFIEYLRIEKGVAGKTVENYFAVLSTFYDYLTFEGLVSSNPVLPIRRRYLRRYKDNSMQERQLISVEAMGQLINSEMDIRNKAIIALLAKTGIRRGELISLDVEDVDLVEMRIKLKPTAKRSNRMVFFDAETAFILRRWLKVREGRNKKGIPALFLNAMGDRLDRGGVLLLVGEAARRVGLHHPESERMEDRFSPHCCRHWFTTHLRRAGMRREFIQELRGDSRREAIDIYDHIDLKELKEAYLAAIPQLGI